MPTRVLFARYMEWCRENNVPVAGKAQDGMLKVWKRLLSIDHKQESRPDEEGIIKRQRCTYIPSPTDIKGVMVRNKNWID